MNRRQFLTSAAASTLTLSLGACATNRSPEIASTTTAPSTPATLPANISWHDVRDWGLEGKGFADTQSFFDRLPGRAKPIVRKEVWNLSHHTAGLSVRFETDSPDIYVRYEVTNATLAMAHMPATGVSGLDLYAMHENRWQWLATHLPRDAAFAGALEREILPGQRLYQVNLPLYNGVKSLEIGISRATHFRPIPPRKERPIVFYGTSITQGGCASRPGMAFISILGRRLNRPTVNLGFSGNGRMEPEVARFISEIDAAFFVIDCVANTSAEPLAQRTGQVVHILRDARPCTPILLLGERRFSNSSLLPKTLQVYKHKQEVFRKVYDDLIASGMAELHFRTGDDLLGLDTEATVDGSHPNDLGMMRFADALEPDLRRLIPD